MAMSARNGIEIDLIASNGVFGELIVHSIAKTAIIPMISAVTDGGIDVVNDTAK